MQGYVTNKQTQTAIQNVTYHSMKNVQIVRVQQPGQRPETKLDRLPDLLNLIFNVCCHCNSVSPETERQSVGVPDLLSDGPAL